MGFPALLFLIGRDDRIEDYVAGQGLFVPPESFMGRRVGEVLPPDAGGRVVEALGRARAAGAPVSVDYALPMPGGERHFEARLRLLDDGRIAALCTDVTERRRAEEEARWQKAQLQHLLSTSPSVIYSLHLGPEGFTIAAVSENLEQVLGWSLADFPDMRTWIEKVHPDDRAAASAAGPRVLAEGRLVHSFRFRHRDGSWRWIRNEMLLVRGEAGHAGEVVGSVSDVTSQREAEERLRQSEERFRNAFANAPVGMALVGLDDRFMQVNGAMCRILGYPAERLLQMTVPQVTHPDDVTSEEAHRARLRRGEASSFRMEKRYLHATGQVVWGSLSVSAVAGDDGRPLYFISQLEDVTGRRQLEDRLLQAQKLESVGRLAGGVAHDFNNLLVAILGYAEFLEKGIREGNPSLDDLAEIRAAGERARDLTRQLLTVARRQVVEPRVMDLNEVLRDAERLLRRVIGEDVDLAVVPAESLWRVKADPAQIQQVVLNLAVNARDAMPRGGKLTLETANVELDERYAASHPGVAPGHYALLAVSDSGTGMSREATAHLFEPFFTTKPAGAGTGLGLATVYGIVKQAGGHISVYSEPGHGTSFKIYLPPTDGAPVPAGVGPAPRPRPGTETVLLVEDASAVRDIAARALAGAGYRVLEAANGQAALQAAARTEGPVHLLLTDVVMPDMSGRQLAEALQQVRPGMRVLYVSGYTEDTILHHGVLEPGVRFLAKPFTPTALQAKVRQVLDGG